MGLSRSDSFEKLRGNSNFAISQTKKHTELIGVNNLILLETADANLVFPWHQSQAVKEVYERLLKVKSQGY